MNEVRRWASLVKHTKMIPGRPRFRWRRIRRCGAAALREGELVGSLSRGDDQPQFRAEGVQVRCSADGAGRTGAVDPAGGGGPHLDKDHPKSLGRKKIPSPSRWAPAGPGRPAGELERELRAAMTALLYDAQQTYDHRPEYWVTAPAGGRSPRRREPDGRKPSGRWPREPGRSDAAALIATDVDGTLLDDTERVTPRTRAAILRGRRRRATFVLATGRRRAGSGQWSTPGTSPLAVCANGATGAMTPRRTASSRTRRKSDALGRLAEIADTPPSGGRARRTGGSRTAARRSIPPVRQLHPAMSMPG